MRSLLAAVLLLPATLHAQALTPLVSLQVGHNALKITARPDSALRVRIDSIDAAIAAANRLGRTGEVRRLFAKASVLLARRPWTPELDYATSLRLRSEQQLTDPAQPWVGRLEQFYLPDIALPRPLSARLELRRRAEGAPPNAPLTVVKALGRVEVVSRDLRDAPLRIAGDLSDVADGRYVVAVVVSDSATELATASLTIQVQRGLAERTARLASAAAKAAEPVRSDLRFAVDRIASINAGQVAMGPFVVGEALASAESLMTAAAKGRDPWAGRTGDMRRHYRLAAADEIMPYRLFVPAGYKRGTPVPMVVALHGLGGTENTFFDGYDKKLLPLAAERGYLVVAPLGYRPDGWYGSSIFPAADAAALRARSLSEQDVRAVIEEVTRQYTVDSTRMYLMGHSMGAIGTWSLAAKAPQTWAAVAAFSGLGLAPTAGAMRGFPHFVVHGDADATVPVGGSRSMVAALKQAGAMVEYIEVPGGNHNDVVAPNLPAMFDFFDRVRAGRVSAARP